MTKPGQSQTVNIARTIPTVSSAALFRPEAIKQILSAAWGTISNHKDTELSIEASHWYAKGAGMSLLGKATLLEMTIPPKWPPFRRILFATSRIRSQPGHEDDGYLRLRKNKRGRIHRPREGELHGI